ncbi:hypothetical protein WICMUC_002580 [Wickerhamomyces mucosus]|uniref:UPF3 domain-containing protein n=1 Tax=Wickerhamomyces mucosus TaxID=1378264 RepID=A0A9P8TDN4_9ASCO|nr:hypothetical protein WICMUC_002580 [Wickerhamomyces mucosus]
MNVSGSRAPANNSTQKLNEIAQRNAFKAAILKRAQQSQNRTVDESNNVVNKPQDKPKRRRQRRKRSKSSTDSDTANGFKVTIRFLPPNLEESKYWETVHDYIKEDLIFSKYFVRGHYSAKPFKLPIYSRAYIEFKSAETADEFVATFKKVPFEDDKESLIPKFSDSLFPQMPKDEKINPQYQGKLKITSLEEHPSYKLFVKVLNKEVEDPSSYIFKTRTLNKLMQNNCDFSILQSRKKTEKNAVKDEKTEGGKKSKKKKNKKENVKKDTSSAKSKAPVVKEEKKQKAKTEGKEKKDAKPKKEKNKDQKAQNKSKTDTKIENKENKSKKSKTKKDKKDSGNNTKSQAQNSPKPTEQKPQKQQPKQKSKEEQPKPKLLVKKDINIPNSSNSPETNSKPKMMMLKRSEN